MVHPYMSRSRTYCSYYQQKLYTHRSHSTAWDYVSSAQAYVTLSIAWVYDTPLLNLVLTLPVETEEVSSG